MIVLHYIAGREQMILVLEDIYTRTKTWLKIDQASMYCTLRNFIWQHYKQGLEDYI
jgi:hypothetical protein